MDYRTSNFGTCPAWCAVPPKSHLPEIADSAPKPSSGRQICLQRTCTFVQCRPSVELRLVRFETMVWPRSHTSNVTGFLCRARGLKRPPSSRLHLTCLKPPAFGFCSRCPVDTDGNARPADLGEQADIYRPVISACLAHAGGSAIQTWGFRDEYSWIGFKTKGARRSALPCDRMYAEKPA